MRRLIKQSSKTMMSQGDNMEMNIPRCPRLLAITQSGPWQSLKPSELGSPTWLQPMVWREERLVLKCSKYYIEVMFQRALTFVVPRRPPEVTAYCHTPVAPAMYTRCDPTPFKKGNNIFFASCGSAIDSRAAWSDPCSAGSSVGLTNMAASSVEDRSWVEALNPSAPNARLKVYIVSFSRLLPETLVGAQGGLRSLDELTRAQVAEFVRESFENPAANETAGGRPRAREEPLVRKVVVAAEKHADGSWHFHAAVLLREPARWPAVKRTLRDRYQMAAHVSVSHREWHSALRYLVFATKKKLEVDADRVLWLGPGETFNAFKESQEPFCAKAWTARREEREMVAGAEEKPPVFTELDFKSWVLSENLKTPVAVMRHVQDHGSACMRLFVARNQKKHAAVAGRG